MEIQELSIFAPAPFCVSRFNADAESVEVVCIGQNMHVYAIDGVSAFIWRQLDGKTSVRQILSRIVKEFEVTGARAKRDLSAFIEQLVLLELIEER